ncbi:MAG: hypothetical protein LBS30_01615 [Planctomycetota bacterium]|jgi:hypothetical protein|nr:hypothetical protein [Planctomycetota bacterium]
MDAFLKKIERLAELAAGESVPQPLDSVGVMNRIRGLEIGREEDRVLSLPLRFWAGGVAAAAAVAIAVSLFAVTAWTEMNSPLTAAESFFDVLDVL